MSEAEKFIEEHTRNCSNYTGVINKKTCEGYYVPWLTPDQALRAVEIARKEMIDKAIWNMKNCRDCIHCTDKGDHLACDYPSMCFQGNGKGDYDKVGYKPKNK